MKRLGFFDPPDEFMEELLNGCNNQSESTSRTSRSGAMDLEEPKNNDGRSICYWCGGETVEYNGFTSKGNICKKCNK